LAVGPHHVAGFHRLFPPVEQDIVLIALCHAEPDRRPDGQEIVPGRQEQIPEFGNEHGFDERGNARDGLALEDDRLKLELDVIGLAVALEVAVVGLNGREGHQRATITAGKARPELVL